MFGIGSVIGEGVGIVRDWLSSRRRIKEAEVETKLKIEEAKQTSAIKVAETGQVAEINWDVIAQKNSEASWKDEWITMLVSIPLILAFIPGGDFYVMKGFEVLRQTPEWYQITVGIVVAASFGYRKAVDYFGKKR